MPRSAITRINGGLQVAANTTNKNNGFYAPQLTTAQRDAIPAGTLTNSAIIYNTTLNVFQSYQTIGANSVWVNLSATTSAATGVGLVNGTPWTLPSGTLAQVEVPGNQIDGFIYYRTDGDIIRIRVAGAWRTIAPV
jgi:hypothetical protein